MELRLSEISKQFGPVRALNEVSLTLTPGSVVALIGPNGSGKTTLLRILAGLLAPDSGYYQVSDRPFRQVRAALARQLGILTEFSYLYNELSVEENLRLMATLHRIDFARDEINAAWHLNRYLAIPVKHLSRGIHQRVAIIRTLLHRPKILLLDEPFAALDEPSIRQTGREIERIRQADGIIVVATHQLSLISSITDKVIMLSGGGLAYFGDLREKPEGVGDLAG